MVSLTRDNVAKDLKEVHLTVQPPDTIIAPKSVNIPTPGTTPDVELVSEPPCTSTQHRDHVGWLFESSDKSTYTPRERGKSEGPARHAPSMYKASATFQSLPTEIHFRIAAFLPDHALHVLARLKYSARLRNVYKKADPQAIRTQWRNLSGFDKSVLQELLLRDAFEKTCKADNPSITANKGVWSKTCFHCLSCNRRVLPTHFPKSEIFESVHGRTGMDKIIDRKCHAELRAVTLWDGKTITWSQLREVWADMDPYMVLPPIFRDYAYYKRKSTKEALETGRYSREGNELRLRDLDHARASWTGYSGRSLRQLGVEATAEYYADLYTLLRFQSIDANTIVSKIQQSRLYVCPHFDLARLVTRRMSEEAVDFRPSGPGPYKAKDRIIDHLVRQLDRLEWREFFIRGRGLGMRSDIAMPKIKEQTLCCGFRNERCQTSVTMQRLRDEDTTAWLRDLVRLKVVRRWRIDRGTGDESWQAQNGTSVRVVDVE